MPELTIKKIHEEYKNTKTFTLPEHLLPYAQGYNLISWAKELLLYYQQEDVVVRPFDDLPSLKISEQPGLAISVQDIHRFIISDLSLIPLETRKLLMTHAVRHSSSLEAWHHIAPLLLDQLEHREREIIMEELTWKFSPVAELLWVITWFFMEREAVFPPRGTHAEVHRFPYYVWLTEEKKLSLWEPEIPLCRWEWLAMDLYNEWMKKSC
ncbi:MAG: hypothetical protein WCQ99_03330 [Pseudomonadota bacterium]